MLSQQNQEPKMLTGKLVTPTNHPSRKSKDIASEVQAGTTQEGP